MPTNKHSTLWLTLIVAMLFPTAMAALYFLLLPGEGKANPLMQTAYIGGKLFQFSLPLLFVRYYRGRWPTVEKPRAEGLGLGIGFGLAVVVAMFVLYHFWLAETSLFAQTPTLVRAKLDQFNVASPGRYLGMALFVIVLHSLMEEYYWRWFVFGELREVVSYPLAVMLSSLAFMSHHVIVLGVYFPGWFWIAVVPFSLGIAVGGAVWAWLYQRTGALWAPWISHLLVDAGIFALGWQLIRAA